MAEARDDTAGPVMAIVERLDSTTYRDRVTLGHVVEAFGRRSFLPMLMVPALLVLSPLSGIPLFSSLCGLTIALISAQMIWPGRDCLWLPGKMTRRNVRGERAREAVRKLGRAARWLDGHARERFRLLVRPPGRSLVELACLLCGLAMPFLEVVPFSSSVLGGAVLLMATGLLTRDGLFALLGLAVMAGLPAIALTAAGAISGAG